MGTIRQPVIVFLITSCLLAASQVMAGAWPRDANDHFSATSFRYGIDPGAQASRLSTSYYHEFGLPNRRGIVFDLGMSSARIDKAMVFYQLSVLGADQPWEMAAALGVGLVQGDVTLSPKLMIGRGLTIRSHPSWVEAAISAQSNLATGDVAAKLDLTFGYSLKPGAKSYFQLFVYAPFAGAPHIRFESSTAIRLFKETWLDIGISTGVIPTTDRQVKIGLWTAF
ncbi:MAG: hypothetical protein ACRBBU_05915 [Pseudooceanicola sp.]